MRQCMDAENLHRRLKKIIGQVQAIDRMVDEDVPCEDVLAQINAAKSALRAATTGTPTRPSPALPRRWNAWPTCPEHFWFNRPPWAAGFAMSPPRWSGCPVQEVLSSPA